MDQLFEVVDTPGKGKGAVAKVDISAGTIILSELPLFSIPAALVLGPTEGEGVIANFLHQVDPDQRHSFLALSNGHETREKWPLWGRLSTNAVYTAGTTRASIFLALSRFNHSCLENAAFYTPEDGHVVKIVAMRDIPKGDEISISYITNDNWTRGRDNRREFLEEKLGCTCVCEACQVDEQSVQESDHRRAEIWRLQEENNEGDRQLFMTDPVRALGNVKRILTLLKEEGDMSTRECGAYNTAFSICAIHSDFARAKAFARLAYETKIQRQGDFDYGEDWRYHEQIEEPEKIPFNGQTKRYATEVGDAKYSDGADFEDWLWLRCTS